jgi:hypothetical protein
VRDIGSQLKCTCLDTKGGESLLAFLECNSNLFFKESDGDSKGRSIFSTIHPPHVVGVNNIC